MTSYDDSNSIIKDYFLMQGHTRAFNRGTN